MATIQKWFSFSENEDFEGPEPPFFDISNKPWKKLLENNYQVILSELQALIDEQNQNIVPYFNQTLASKPTSWTVFPLIFWNKPYEDNCLKVPKTLAVIRQIPGVMSCGFSILKANSRIKPHYGDSNVMYRCHLTLRCPGTLPEIGFRVKDQTIAWETGKLIAFCDAHNHEVWNDTSEDRWILIIDILREELLPEQKKICKLVNATLWWQLKFQKHYFMKHLPRWTRRWMMYATAPFMAA
ncbi:MAG: aspartyl/asparaginyl beta-hydroxylase domain-containing protein [Bacteroidetes bacterium]|nr:aspartyl/asparaginyl beta-hydroxylase domain-containing protein [Bacteroidota bacterium]